MFAGIVLYNPDLLRLNENIRAIMPQVECLILIDNGSNNIQLIKETYAELDRIYLVENNENKGVAVALNQIMKISSERNAEWTLLLDQDSVCPSDIIDKYKRYVDINNLAIICPSIIDRNPGSQVVNENLEFEFIKETITSGTLLNNEIWFKVGDFNEKMFIDYVDLEYCKRIRVNGYLILRINDISLLHEIGHRKVYKFLWKNVSTYEHSAFRKYYITRNTLYYSYKYRDEESLLISYLKIMKRFLIVILYESNKKEKARAMLKGIIDSFKMN